MTDERAVRLALEAARWRRRAEEAEALLAQLLNPAAPNPCTCKGDDFRGDPNCPVVRLRLAPPQPEEKQ